MRSENNQLQNQMQGLQESSNKTEMTESYKQLFSLKEKLKIEQQWRVSLEGENSRLTEGKAKEQMEH